MIENFKKTTAKAFVIMLIGNIIVSLGVSLFKIAGLGNDPFNAMLMSIYAKLDIHYGTLSAIISTILFIIQFKFGKEYIGYGTLVNTFLVGYIIAFFIEVFESKALVPIGFLAQVIVMFIGVLICALGISIYQLANLGTSPFDSMSLILSERLKNIPYLFLRIFTDGVCAFIAFLLGGLLGLGSIVAMLGLGPIVQIYNKLLSKWIIDEKN